MRSITFNTASHFLMSQHGMGGGGGAGPIKPVTASIDAFAKIDNGLNGFDQLVQGAAAAKNSLAEGMRGLRDHVRAMEGELFRSRERIAELEGRFARVDQEKRDSIGNVERLERELASVREGVKSTEETAAEQRREWNTMTSLLKNQLAKTAETVEMAGGLFDKADLASVEIAAVDASITSLIGSLKPIMGVDSPVVTSLAENAAALGGIIALCKELSEARDDLMPLIEGEIISGDSASIVYRHLSLPPLDEASLRLIPMLSQDKETLNKIFRRLQTMFKDMAPEKNAARLDAFMKAFGTLRENQKIEGARGLIDNTIKTFADGSKKDWETRGFYYQFIRIAHMIASGRTIDSISHVVPRVNFLGWILHRGQNILSHVTTAEAEIDAMAGGTLIEFKTVWMGGLLGKYLMAILEREGDPSAIPVETDAIEEIGSHAEHAVKIANQLAKYKELIRKGLGKRLELHVTSYDPVPDEVIAAIHRFFDDGRVAIHWYDDLLGTEGKLLDVMAAEAAPAVEAKPQVEERRLNASAAVYQFGIAQMVDHNTSRIENFIDWLVSEGYWTEIMSASSVNKGAIKDALMARMQEWIEIESRPSSVSTANPWASVRDVTAQRLFDRLFREQTQKTLKLDWRQRVTQGIQNTDVMKVMAHLLDIRGIAGDQDLSTEIGDFIRFLKVTYRPEAYFKTDVDGTRLLDILKRYCWVTDQG